MPMGFDARVIIIRAKYSDLTKTRVSQVLNELLQFDYSLGLEREVTLAEYEKNIKSKEISRYIRIPVKQETTRTQYKLHKVGAAKVEHEVFADSRYFAISISQMDEFICIWFNFNVKIQKIINSFDSLFVRFVQRYSELFKTESIYMRATSFSRNDDLFYIFSNGRRQEELSGKSSLTDVKNKYGIDINKAMDNIDNNLAIFYAPKDYAIIQKDLADQKKRYEEFLEQKDSEDLALNDKEDGKSMTEKFEMDNKNIMAELNRRLEMVKIALTIDPLGSVLFFKLRMVEGAGAKIPEQELHFGRSVEKPT